MRAAANPFLLHVYHRPDLMTRTFLIPIRPMVRLRRSIPSSSSSSSFSSPFFKYPSSSSSRRSAAAHRSPSTQQIPLETDSDRAAANRSRVYSFLRSAGISPGDQLDGLELPVTIDVMRDRLDFLLSIGLSAADIDAYPLVLGCSVRKNMIPVLDFLGRRIGLRSSAVAPFLHRYPQVLHSSVAVDLEPVVQHLAGVGVAPADIAGVLERYPELLGFKLEGTMSTSVAYLVAIGVSRRRIGGVLTRFPEVLGMRVGRTIKPFVEHLEGMGLQRLAVARMIEDAPYVLGFDLEDVVKPKIDALLEVGVRKEAVPAVVARYPDILGATELRPKLAKLRALLELSFGEMAGFVGMIERMPELAGLTGAAVAEHAEFFGRSGFSREQVGRMVAQCPQLLALDMEVMKASLDYLEGVMGRGVEDVVAFPEFFTYGLGSTIRPRHEAVSEKRIECSLAWMLGCSDAKFHERISYESIGMEEEVEAEPSLAGGLSEEEEEKDEESKVEEDDDGVPVLSALELHSHHPRNQ